MDHRSGHLEQKWGFRRDMQPALSGHINKLNWSENTIMLYAFLPFPVQPNKHNLANNKEYKIMFRQGYNQIQCTDLIFIDLLHANIWQIIYGCSQTYCFPNRRSSCLKPLKNHIVIRAFSEKKKKHDLNPQCATSIVIVLERGVPPKVR
jgi:hypothetical protein